MIKILILLLIPTFCISATPTHSEKDDTTYINRPLAAYISDNGDEVSSHRFAPALSNESIIRACSILVIYFILDWYFLREKH